MSCRRGAPGAPGGRAAEALCERALAPAHRARLAGSETLAATPWAVLDRFEHAEQLTHAADQEPLLVDLDPHAGGRRKHDVIAGPDRHRDPDVLPPVQSGPDREHDAVQRWRFLRARRHDQPGTSNPIGVELLDYDAIEEGA